MSYRYFLCTFLRVFYNSMFQGISFTDLYIKIGYPCRKSLLLDLVNVQQFFGCWACKSRPIADNTCTWYLYLPYRCQHFFFLLTLLTGYWESENGQGRQAISRRKDSKCDRPQVLRHFPNSVQMVQKLIGSPH